MYLFESMVDMALPKGMEWPSEEHRLVAIRLLIANPEITTLTSIKNGVMSVMRIPLHEVKEIDLDDLCTYRLHTIIKG